MVGNHFDVSIDPKSFVARYLEIHDYPAFVSPVQCTL